MTPDILTKSLGLAAYTLHNTPAGESFHTISSADSNQTIENIAAIGLGVFMIIGGLGLVSYFYNKSMKEFSKPKDTDNIIPTTPSQENKQPFIIVKPSNNRQATTRRTKIFPNGVSALDKPAPREDKAFYE